MGAIKYILITTLLAFTVLNILSVNIFNPSIHDAKIQKAFKTAAEIRAKGSMKDPKPAAEEQAALVIRDHNGNVQTRPKAKDIYSLSTTLDRLLYHFPYNMHEKVETNIYQMWKTLNTDTEHNNYPAECNELIQRWRDANTDHEHYLLSLQDAEDQVADSMRPLVPEVIDALRLLPHDRLKFEFLKYLLVYLYGGVYADIDTTNVKPIKHWYNLKTVETKVWLGVNSDSNSPDWMDHFSRRLTFGNNIFRSKAYHPLLARLIARITFIIFTQKELIKSIDWEAEFKNTDASGSALIQFTGAYVLTDTAFEYMNHLKNYAFFTSLKNSANQDNIQLAKQVFGPQVDPAQKFSYKTFTMLSSPAQVYDVAVLPKISFTGYDSAQIDFYDDNDEKKGYEKFYYGRSKDLTEWSPKRLRLDSN